MDGHNSDETFPPSGGRVTGVLALLIGFVIVGFGIVGGDSVSWTAVGIGLLFAALAWVALLRPRVAIQGDHLVLRNMVDTVRVPLSAVEDVVVRQVLAVRVGQKRYTSAAVGRSRRAISKESGPGRLGAVGPSQRSSDTARSLIGESSSGAEAQAFGLFVQERIRERAETARAGLRHTGAPGTAEHPVRRELAVPEIVWLGVAAVVTVLAILH